MFEHLENAMCDELDRLNEEYKGGKEITSGDLAKADLIGHALKSLATYEAMKGSSGYDEGASERSYGGSYARGRSRTTGRYMSREGGSMMGSRGGYPREMIDPYWDRR